MSARPRLQREASNEVAMADYVPYSSLVTDRIVKTVDGAWIATWQLEGIPFETVDAEDLQQRHEEMNQVLRSLCSSTDGRIALWAHRVRRPISDRLSGEYANAFARDVAQRYQDTFCGARMMTNDSYLSLVYRPHMVAIQSNPLLRLISSSHARSIDDIRADESEALKVMGDLCLQIENGFKKFKPTPLAIYTRDGRLFSRQLEFYAFLLNGQWRPVGVQATPIREYLPAARLFFGGEKIELRTPEGVSFGALLDLRDYPDGSKPGMLDELLYAPYPYIETHSFSLLGKAAARSALTTQQNRLISTDDAASGQIEAISIALEELINGNFVLGEYHYSFAVLGDTPAEVGQNLAHARTTINNAGYQASLIDLVADAAWFAQLPGNWAYRPREAKLTSRNLCGFVSFHGFGVGKRDNNPWGEAVSILKTPNGAPFYFNWHGTPEDEDSHDKKAPGNTTIIGMTGSGKTVLELFLLVQSMKYEPTMVFFDKDRGAEIAIRAMGGIYRRFRRGQPTGCNPFHLAATDINFRFLERLVSSLVTPSLQRPLTVQEEQQLSMAIRKVMEFERRQRRLSVLNQMLPISQSEGGGIHEHLQKWCQGGSLGWLLDNPDDRIDLSQGRLFGFDDTEFLEDREILAPMTMYLLHLTESLIDGRRFIYVMAEFWKRLELPEFTDFAVNKQYTIRKQNGFGVFDTQSPAQILKSPHVAAMVEQSATQIFLPNPKADHDDYVKGFKVTEAEYQVIRSLGEASRKFLVKQGHTSTVVTLDLGGLGDLLDILSTTADNVELLDEIRIEVGDDPQDWMPVFRQRLDDRRQRRAI